MRIHALVELCELIGAMKESIPEDWHPQVSTPSVFTAVHVVIGCFGVSSCVLCVGFM
jgi:hypothetical protein